MKKHSHSNWKKLKKNSWQQQEQAFGVNFQNQLEQEQWNWASKNGNLNSGRIIRLNFGPELQKQFLAAVERSRRRRRRRVEDAEQGTGAGDQAHNVENRQEKEVSFVEYSGVEEADNPAVAVLAVEVELPPASRGGSGGGGFCGVR